MVEENLEVTILSRHGKNVGYDKTNWTPEATICAKTMKVILSTPSLIIVGISHLKQFL